MTRIKGEIKKQNNEYRPSGVLVSFIFLLACLACAWPNVNSIRGAVFISPKSYKTTTGIVTQSLVYRSGAKSSNYNFNIVYIYSVEGELYSSRQVTFGSRLNGGSSAEGYTQKYPVGHKVTVHYKADEPSFAVLEPTVVDQTRVIFGFIATVSSLCILSMAWSVLKLLRRRRT